MRRRGPSEERAEAHEGGSMNAYEFMGAHPVLTFFLAYFAAWALANLFKRPKCGCSKKD